MYWRAKVLATHVSMHCGCAHASDVSVMWVTLYAAHVNQNNNNNDKFNHIGNEIDTFTHGE